MIIISAVVVAVAVMMVIVALLCRCSRRPCPRRLAGVRRRQTQQYDAVDLNTDLLPTNDRYRQLTALGTAVTDPDLASAGGTLERLELGDLRNEIVFVADIARCAFGRVFLARLPHQQGSGSETPPRQQDRVAVKMLNDDADVDARRQFVAAASTLAELNHANVVRLIGVCIRRSPLCVVLEYMDAGDLSEYLRRHDRYSVADRGPMARPLTPIQRVDIVAQMAGAMAYVASRGFVHRDVAARNFLVSEDSGSGESQRSEPCVKLGDFMLALRVTSPDGVCRRADADEALPVRWLAPECLADGRFSTASDVWSFGVAFWEVFAHGRQPYAGVPNSEVERRIGEGLTLPRPVDAPEETYTLMCRCWQWRPHHRPSFDSLLSSMLSLRVQMSTRPSAAVAL